jgi:glutaredoxin 3
MFNPRVLGGAVIKRASGSLLKALYRADELGGQLRDQVSDKLVALRDARRATRDAEVRPATISAPSKPAAARKPPPSGLGDPARPVQIFGRASCPWSGRALALIKRTGIEYAYFDLDGYGSDTVLRELKLETKQDSIPYVFVRGRFIGGYNALDELDRLGHLEYLALPENERPLHPMHGRIEVIPRRHDGERIPGEAGYSAPDAADS